MSDKPTALTPELHGYLIDHGARQDDVLRRLAEETAALGDIAVMQVAPDQGAFLTLLTRAIGARRAVEVGTFTGYSAICIARGLADDGRLTTCDVSEEWTGVARSYFAEAGVEERIDLRIGPALDTLRALPDDEPIDLAFIDADKPSYDAYYEQLLPRMRRGGLILIDNVLWMGQVLDESDTSEHTEAIRALNDKLVVDERIDISMLPIADGLTIARRR